MGIRGLAFNVLENDDPSLIDDPGFEARIEADFLANTVEYLGGDLGMGLTLDDVLRYRREIEEKFEEYVNLPPSEAESIDEMSRAWFKAYSYVMDQRRRGNQHARQLAKGCEEVYGPMPGNTDIVMDFLVGPGHTPVPRETPAPTATPLPSPLQVELEQLGFIFPGEPQRSQGWADSPDYSTTVSLLGENVRLSFNVGQGETDEDRLKLLAEYMLVFARHLTPGSENAVVVWLAESWADIWETGPPISPQDFPDSYSKVFDGVRVKASINNGGFFLNYDYYFVAEFWPRGQR